MHQNNADIHADARHQPMAHQLLLASAYTSEQALERERQQQLFGHCWNFAGMAHDIAQPIDKNPLASGNSAYEDMWACRQMHRAMLSPKFRVSGFARTYETMINFFQKNLLDFIDYS